MNEIKLISEINKIMPRSENQINKPFESDSEILNSQIKGFLLYNIDEYSEEDLFLTDNPYLLGYNIAAATLSDIYASGGNPKYYSQSLCINCMFNEHYLKKFHQGIADVLKQTNTKFIGGDLSKASSWRCCASVIGESDKPIMRSGAKIGDSIYITGKVGGGNLQAASSLFAIKVPEVKFNVRHEKIELINNNATSCIDTSDGLLNSINLIAEQSGVGFKLFNVPYLEGCNEVAQNLKLPMELFTICESGEYELLFTAPENINLPFYKVGEIIPDEKLLNNKDIKFLNSRARDASDIKNYIKETVKLWSEI